MTDKRSNKLADDCMSCIKCDSDFDGVIGFRELVTEKENDKRFVIDKSNSWWDLTDTKEDTSIDGSLHFQCVMEQVCNLLNELHEENERLKSTSQKQAELFGVQVEKMIKETDDFLKEVFKVEK